jgi:hypothetical protein
MPDSNPGLVRLTCENNTEEGGVGVDHPGALPPRTAAAEEGDNEDDRTCGSDQIYQSVINLSSLQYYC